MLPQGKATGTGWHFVGEEQEVWRNWVRETQVAAGRADSNPLFIARGLASRPKRHLLYGSPRRSPGFGGRRLTLELLLLAESRQKGGHQLLDCTTDKQERASVGTALHTCGYTPPRHC